MHIFSRGIRLHNYEFLYFVLMWTFVIFKSIYTHWGGGSRNWCKGKPTDMKIHQQRLTNIFVPDVTGCCHGHLATLWIPYGLNCLCGVQLEIVKKCCYRRVQSTTDVMFSQVSVRPQGRRYPSLWSHVPFGGFSPVSGPRFLLGVYPSLWCQVPSGVYPSLWT